MYTIIPELKENDIHLVDTNDLIWIGISDKNTPMIRKQSHRFRHCKVYLYNGRRVFEWITDYKTKEKEFYYIPDEELFFIERDY